MFYNIAVLYDFSEPSQKALTAAGLWAQAFKGSLEVIHVIPNSSVLETLSSDSVSENALQALKTQIEKDIQKQVPTSVTSTVAILKGHTANIILEALDAEKFDLVIMGTHGYSGISRLVMGSVAEKTVQHSPVPVLVVRGDTQTPPQKILVPVDFNDFAEELFLHMFELSKILNVTFDLIHVIPLSNTVQMFPAGIPNIAPVDTDLLCENARAQMKTLAEKHPSLNVNLHTIIAPISEGICTKAASLKSDMILIQTHGYKGTQHFIMGSVAQQVVRYAPCPVLSFTPSSKSN